jgi:hypothetical protein
MTETNETKTAKKSVVVALGIICIVLVASLTVSVAVYTSMIRDRDSTISSLNSKVSSLQTQVDELLNQTVQSNLYYDEFGNVSILSRSYDFSPPVSMYAALRTALESDEWNASSLSNKIVWVFLEYVEFIIAPNFFEFSPQYNVTQPAKDYSPVQVNGTTYRYIWDIIVYNNPIGFGQWYPLFGPTYRVDAATGEILPLGPIL